MQCFQLILNGVHRKKTCSAKIRRLPCSICGSNLKGKKGVFIIQRSDFFENIEFNRNYQLLSSQWKVYILFALSEGPMRFGELYRLISRISRVTLTGYLQDLEREGYILRIEYPAPPLHTEYSLTSLALGVVPIIKELLAWGGGE